MKYRVLALTLALCCAMTGAFAQDIDALLSKMPADNAAAFNAACADMIAAGPDAIQQIAARLVPMGQGDDNAARYAISGLAKYVSRAGAEAERQLFAQALGAALQTEKPAEIKQFLMHQLELAGGQESVPVLQSFLSDPELGGPASRALEALGVIAAPTAAQSAPAATANANPALQEAQQLLAEGKARDAAKLLEGLVEDAQAPAQTRIEALTLLVAERQRAALFTLIAAGTAEDASLRAAALELAPRIDGTVATKKWGRALEDATPDAQIGILAMLGARGDDTAVPAIAEMLESDDHAVRLAAVEALKTLGTPKAIEALQQHRSKTKDSGDMAAVKDALRQLAPDTIWTPAADAEGFIPLIHDNSLEGWTGHLGGYENQGGVLVSKKHGLNLYTEDAYGNFILRFEFLLTENANSGIGIRVPLYGHASEDGMEIQVLDDGGSEYTELKPYQYHGSVYGIVPAERGHLKPVGQWNTQEITVEGPRVKVVLNGQTIVDADVVEAATPAPMDEKDHPGLTRDKGHISLAGHSTVVSFRNMKVKPLN
jgi:hypothetical protein